MLVSWKHLSSIHTNNSVTCGFGLQKLLVTIDSSQRDRVREYQRRCEEALTDVLLKGAAPPVGLPEIYPSRCHSMFGCTRSLNSDAPSGVRQCRCICVVRYLSQMCNLPCLPNSLARSEASRHAGGLAGMSA